MSQDVRKKLTGRSLPRELKLAVEACLEKKGEELCVLELKALSSFTDYFLITQGNSTRQNTAVSEAVEAGLKRAGIRPLSIEGREAAEWILMDYGHFIVHVFSPKTRDHYSLEKLWGDAPRLDF
jgi:ribosome-associated protein